LKSPDKLAGWLGVRLTAILRAWKVEWRVKVRERWWEIEEWEKGLGLNLSQT
jgi:hypothetical protein